MKHLNLFKALSDKSRLMIIETLIQQPSYVEALAERLGLTPATISFHLRKLEKAGLVTSKKEQFYVNYTINQKVLKQPIINLIQSTNSEKDVLEKRHDKYIKKVEASFFKYGKLKTIPVQQKKRRIILERIIRENFKANKEYKEPEINRTLLNYHEDFCTLRRELICEKLMRRKNGTYQLA